MIANNWQLKFWLELVIKGKSQDYTWAAWKMQGSLQCSEMLKWVFFECLRLELSVRLFV